MNERYDMGTCANEVNCNVVEKVKINTLRLFGHLDRMKSERVKVYVSEIEGPRRRGRPVETLKERVKEYMHEGADRRGLNKQGGSIWMGRDGSPSAVDVPREDEASETIDR